MDNQALKSWGPRSHKLQFKRRDKKLLHFWCFEKSVDCC